MSLTARLPLGRIFLILSIAAVALFAGALAGRSFENPETLAASTAFERAPADELPAFDPRTGQRVAPAPSPAAAVERRRILPNSPPLVAGSASRSGLPGVLVTGPAIGSQVARAPAVCGSREALAGQILPGQSVSTGNPDSGRIALTFDMDEGQIGSLPVILTALQQHHARATFFVTGSWAETNPDWLRRLLAEGHTLGNHSYNHPDFRFLTREQIIDEIESTERIVRELTGATTRPYFRPPFAAYNEVVANVVAELGYAAILWDVDPQDWRGHDGSTIAQHVLREASPGRIVIMHGYPLPTGEALSTILSGLPAAGVLPGTLAETLQGRCG